MNRFATGVIACGLIGAAALSWALSDGRTRRHVMRDGKRMMGKANDIADGVL